MTTPPFIFDVLTETEKRSRPPKGRPLTLAEMGKLFDAATPPHVRIFPLLLVNTLCRPDAALDLTTDQLDWEHGLIRLNPEGRPQSKKHRPIVPMTQTIRPHLAGLPAGPVVWYHSEEMDGETCRRKMATIRTAWRELRETAGFVESDPANPYSIRHTLPRALRRARVPPEEVSLMLGHIPTEGSRTSMIYGPYDPDYCVHAVEAIDAYCTELQTHVGWPIVLTAGARHDADRDHRRLTRAGGRLSLFKPLSNNG